MHPKFCNTLLFVGFRASFEPVGFSFVLISYTFVVSRQVRQGEINPINPGQPGTGKDPALEEHISQKGRPVDPCVWGWMEEGPRL